MKKLPVFSKINKLNASLKRYISLVFLSILLSVVIFALVSINSGLAWFSENKNAEGNQMNISLNEPEGTSATVTVHNILGKENNTLYFDKSIGTASIPKYNILDDIARYLLICIEFPSSTNLTLTVDTETQYFSDGKTVDGIIHPALNANSNPLSNIISFSVINATEEPNNATFNSKDAYAVTMPSNELSFANENADTKEMEITSSIELVSGNYETIYILISYNEYNITKLYSENIGNPVFSEQSVIDNGIQYSIDFIFNIK